MTTLPHVAAPPGDIYWREELPPARGAKMLLLTVGGTAVIGCWYGKLGEAFTAWSPLPKSGQPAA